MSPAHIIGTLFASFKSKKVFYWFLVLGFASFGPLITTYIFSRGIHALEIHIPLNEVVMIFLGFLGVMIVEIIIRVAAKTRIQLYVERNLVNLRQAFLKDIKVRSKYRKATVQAVRNLTQSVRTFLMYFVNTGVAGVVSFVSVPFLLFFIDIKVFWIEMALIGTYLLATYFFARRYERCYERYDESKEDYFARMETSNKIRAAGNKIVAAMHKLQDVRLYEWVSLQNLIVIFQFLIIIVVATDIVNGLKGISDLVLIIGYVKESQKFLNSITGDLNRFMQIRAGVERLAVTSNGAPRGSVVSLH